MSAAIVTGASGGIGGELAKGLVRDWGIDEIWLVARNEERLEKISEELLSLNRELRVKRISADLGSDEGIGKSKLIIL